MYPPRAFCCGANFHDTDKSQRQHNSKAATEQCTLKCNPRVKVQLATTFVTQTSALLKDINVGWKMEGVSGS